MIQFWLKLFIWFSNGWFNHHPDLDVCFWSTIFFGESFKGSLLGKSFQKPGSPRGGGVNVKKKQVTEVSDIYCQKYQIYIYIYWSQDHCHEHMAMFINFQGVVVGFFFGMAILMSTRPYLIRCSGNGTSTARGFRGSGTDPPCRSPRFRKSGPERGRIVEKRNFGRDALQKTKMTIKHHHFCFIGRLRYIFLMILFPLWCEFLGVCSTGEIVEGWVAIVADGSRNVWILRGWCHLKWPNICTPWNQHVP